MDNTARETGSDASDKTRLLEALKEARRDLKTIEFSADAGLVDHAVEGSTDTSGRLDDISHHAQQAGGAIDTLLVDLGEAPAHLPQVIVPGTVEAGQPG